MPPLFTDEDCNLPSQERVVLLKRLQVLLGDVSPHFWAACQLCDLGRLSSLVQSAEINAPLVVIADMQTYSMIANWNQAIPGPASAATTPRSLPVLQGLPRSLAGPSSSPLQGSSQEGVTPPFKRQKTVLSRSRSIRNVAAARDKFRCVLTGSNIIQVAHIYPFCLMDRDEDKSGKKWTFWAVLGAFWPKSKIASWQATIFPNGPGECGCETVKNMVTLSPDAHYLWNQGAFALKPISVSEDNLNMTVQFFWQVKHSSDGPTVDITTLPATTGTLESNDGNRLINVRQPELRCIKSGNLFELTTDDPEARPLPSMALLEMQWFLQRVMGMAGAADELKDDYYHFSDDGFIQAYFERAAGEDTLPEEFDESEDDVNNLELDEVGDESFQSKA